MNKETHPTTMSDPTPEHAVRCANCLHWEPTGRHTRLSWCTVFSKHTDADHGSHCTAFVCKDTLDKAPAPPAPPVSQSEGLRLAAPTTDVPEPPWMRLGHHLFCATTSNYTQEALQSLIRDCCEQHAAALAQEVEQFKTQAGEQRRLKLDAQVESERLRVERSTLCDLARTLTQERNRARAFLEHATGTIERLTAERDRLRKALEGCNEMFDTYGHTSESPCERDKEIIRDMLAALSAPKEALPLYPRIVCLCGSTRFFEAFQEASLKETVAGKIVLSIGCNLRSDHQLWAEPSERAAIKERLDELHKRKIDLADEVFVLNIGGYIGDSTRSEIDYAIAHGKPVRYLENLSAPKEGQ